MNPAFYEAAWLEFRRAFKREFYAYAYGNYKATLLSHDVLSAYQMGTEL